MTSAPTSEFPVIPVIIGILIIIGIIIGVVMATRPASQPQVQVVTQPAAPAPVVEPSRPAAQEAPQPNPAMIGPQAQYGAPISIAGKIDATKEPARGPIQYSDEKMAEMKAMAENPVYPSEVDKGWVGMSGKIADVRVTPGEQMMPQEVAPRVPEPAPRVYEPAPRVYEPAPRAPAASPLTAAAWARRAPAPAPGF